MSLRRRKVDWSKRCLRCWLHRELCLCSSVTAYTLKTRVLVMMDERESHQTTNTSHLVPLVLENAEVRIRSRHDHEACAEDLVPRLDAPIWLLFPGPSARVLTPALVAAGPPSMLVVPDATWRNAARMVRQVPAMSTLPRVTLPPGPPAMRWLRRPPQESALSTLEAIARALGIIEDGAVRRELERVLMMMVDRHRWSKGLLPADRVFGGIPEGFDASKWK